jgi:hypothetical protein
MKPCTRNWIVFSGLAGAFLGCGGGQNAAGSQANVVLTVTGAGVGSVLSAPGCGAGCTTTSAIYTSGTAVTLTASPGSGYTVTWSDCDTQSGNTCNLTMSSPKTVTATFTAVTQDYTLTLNKVGAGGATSAIGGNGISCGAGCTTTSAIYTSGTAVTLTASPGSGYTVTWSGCDTQGGNTCNLTMNSPKTVTATFTAVTQNYTLTLNKGGAGGATSTVAGNGIICGTGCTTTSAIYTSGTAVTLAASPGSGYTVTWSDCDTQSGNSCNLTMTSPRTVTATFTAVAQNYTLTAQKAGAGASASTVTGGGISCGATCSASYPSGTTVTLTATAGYGYSFSRWDGCDSPSGNSCTMTMNGSKQVTATFLMVVEVCPPSTPLCHTLTVQKAGAGASASAVTGGGIDCGAICSAAFAGGVNVTLTAKAGLGYGFSRWEGCDAPSGATCVMTMGVNKTVTATFEAGTQSFTLSVEKNGAGPESTVRSTDRGAVIDCGPTCSATLAAGTGVTLTAAGGSGYQFSGYQGCDSVARTNICYVTMNANRRVMATFTPLAQVCSPNATRCIANKPGSQHVCDAQGAAWTEQTCGAWKLCSDAKCRIVCEVTEAAWSKPTVCFVPNKDGVNDGILYYANFPDSSKSLAPPTYSTAFTLSQSGSAPIDPIDLSDGSNWPYAWSLISPSGVAAARFRLDQFPGLPPTVNFYFRVRDSQIAFTSSAYLLITAGTQGVPPFRVFHANSSLGYSWIDSNWSIGGAVGAGWNFAGGGNEFDLGSTTSGFGAYDVSSIDVNYIAVEVVQQ